MIKIFLKEEMQTSFNWIGRAERDRINKQPGAQVRDADRIPAQIKKSTNAIRIGRNSAPEM